MFPAAGKHGKTQSCQSKEPTANEWNDSIGAPFIRRNDARRHLVVATVARLSRLINVYRLFHVGRFSGGALFFWQLHLAFLFAGDFWRFATQLVWTQTRVVARLAHFLSRAISSLDPRGVSRDVLLLSRRFLQSVKSRSARLHSRRTAQKLLGRSLVPAHHAKRAPLLFLFSISFPSSAGLRCLESTLVSKWIWHWCWHHRACNQRRFARRLYVWLSLATAFSRRISGSIFQIADMLSRLRVRNLFQSPPYALGLAEPVLGRFRRSLRAPVRNGDLA